MKEAIPHTILKIFIIILISLILISLSYCVYMLYRNNQIFDMRIKVLNEIYEIGMNGDINESLRLSKAYNIMSYQEMMSLKNMFVPITKLEEKWKNRMGFTKDSESI